MQSPSPLPSISPETVSRAGAGALLLAIAAAELWLAFWTAGWWHRCGASLIAVVGAALLIHAAAAVVRPLRAELAHRVRRWQLRFRPDLAPLVAPVIAVPLTAARGAVVAQDPQTVRSLLRSTDAAARRRRRP